MEIGLESPKIVSCPETHPFRRDLDMQAFIDHALRRWERIKPPPGRDMSAAKAKELSDWLNKDVCRVAEALIARPDLQALAKQPLTLLLPDRSRSEARIRVERIDSAITETARSLAIALRRPEILQAYHQHHTAVAQRTGNPEETADRLEQQLTLLDRIAHRPWLNLASARDYFGPAAGLNLRPVPQPNIDEPQPELGDFNPYFNRDLRRLGDFVFRCLLIRVEYWRRPLRAAWVEADTAVREAGLEAAEVRLIREAWKEIDPALAALRAAYEHHPDAPARDAAVVLMQLLAAYRPNTGFQWLGQEAAAVVKRAALLRGRVDRQQDVSIAESAAAALEELRRRAGEEPDLDLIIKEARRSYILLIVDVPGRREVYFEGRQLEADWNSKKRAWSLLCDVAKAARQRARVRDDERDYSARDARQDLTRRDDRRLLPDELIEKLKMSKGEHWLELDRDQVFVITAEPTQRVLTSN